MGTASSQDTRRISFDNTFAISPALVIHNKSMGVGDDSVLDLDALASVTENRDSLVSPQSKIPPPREQESIEVDYWSNRIESLRQEHRLINKIIEAEYEKTLDKASILLKPFNETTSYDAIKPCLEWRSKILKCYEENTHKPLVCSALVNAFNDCVMSCQLKDRSK
ncbi:hypothetical protein O0L34_g9616 [Tuta absoluta]|nr:hypothetical protein O0L34_g9616 [Tuta absoluta]